MPVSGQLTAAVSIKGQVTLPRATRRSSGWEAGTRLIVESTSGGVPLRLEPVFAETRPEEVFGRLATKGAPKSLAEMDNAGSWRKRGGATGAGVVSPNSPPPPPPARSLRPATSRSTNHRCGPSC